MMALKIMEPLFYQRFRTWGWALNTPDTRRRYSMCQMSKRAILLLAASACLWAQSAAIDGTAVDASTGQPLAGVHVRVFTIGSAGTPTAYGAMTDNAGHFSIAGLRPGTYLCMGEKAGYLSVRTPSGPSPAPTITVKAGENLAALKVEMTPRATIGGRVVDEFGDPVQNASVQVTPVSKDAPV